MSNSDARAFKFIPLGSPNSLAVPCLAASVSAGGRSGQPRRAARLGRFATPPPRPGRETTPGRAFSDSQLRVGIQVALSTSDGAQSSLDRICERITATFRRLTQERNEARALSEQLATRIEQLLAQESCGKAADSVATRCGAR